MLLAGVALSIMLAMIAIPMFGNAEKFVEKQKLLTDITAIKDAFKIIDGMGDLKKYSSSVDSEKYKILLPYLKGFETGRKIEGFLPGYHLITMSNFPDGRYALIQTPDITYNKNSSGKTVGMVYIKRASNKFYGFYNDIFPKNYNDNALKKVCDFQINHIAFDELVCIFEI